MPIRNGCPAPIPAPVALKVALIPPSPASWYCSTVPAIGKDCRSVCCPLSIHSRCWLKLSPSSGIWLTNQNGSHDLHGISTLCILSNPEDRYQCRVVRLVPMLVVTLLTFIDRRISLRVWRRSDNPDRGDAPRKEAIASYDWSQAGTRIVSYRQNHLGCWDIPRYAASVYRRTNRRQRSGPVRFAANAGRRPSV